MPSKPKKKLTPSSDYDESPSLSEAIETVEGKEKTPDQLRTEKVFWNKLNTLPENAHEERGTLYYYILRLSLQSSRLFENEKHRTLYQKMRQAFREQKKSYLTTLRQKPSERLPRLQYHAFLKLAERYFLVLEILYRRKSWSSAALAAHTDKMYYHESICLYEKKYHEWAFYKFLQISSNYGESFWRWGLTTLFFFVFFGLLFLIIDSVQTGGQLVAHKPGGAENYLYFSIVTFTTLGFGDLTPITSLQKTLVGIEAVSGYFMLGSFMALLQRKMK